MASKDADVEDLFTLEKVRRLSGLSIVELEARIDAGVLRGRRLGRLFISTFDDVLTFLEAEGFSQPKLRMAAWDSGGGFTFGKRARERVMAGALGLSMLLSLVVFGIAFLVGDRRGDHAGLFRTTRFMAIRVELTTAPAGLGDRARGAIGASGRAMAPRDRGTDLRQKPREREERPARKVPRTLDRAQPTAEPNTRAVQAKSTASIDSTARTESAERSGGEVLKNDDSGVAGAAPGPYRPGAGVTAPLLISRVRPDYPPAARAAGAEGTVDLEIIVSSDGSVGNIKVLRVPREGLGFEEAAVAAVRQWRFMPGSYLGKPTGVIAEVSVYFTIDR